MARSTASPYPTWGRTEVGGLRVALCLLPTGETDEASSRSPPFFKEPNICYASRRDHVSDPCRVGAGAVSRLETGSKRRHGLKNLVCIVVTNTCLAKHCRALLNLVALESPVSIFQDSEAAIQLVVLSSMA